MTKRRNKRAMLKRAFERVGFTVIRIERDQYGDYAVYHANARAIRFIRKTGLRVLSYGLNGSGEYSIDVRWTVAFERWYQEEIGTDG